MSRFVRFFSGTDGRFASCPHLLRKLQGQKMGSLPSVPVFPLHTFQPRWCLREGSTWGHGTKMGERQRLMSLDFADRRASPPALRIRRGR
jgi:hypothetical protein